eukprot:UN08738
MIYSKKVQEIRKSTQISDASDNIDIDTDRNFARSYAYRSFKSSFSCNKCGALFKLKTVSAGTFCWECRYSHWSGGYSAPKRRKIRADNDYAYAMREWGSVSGTELFDC